MLLCWVVTLLFVVVLGSKWFLGEFFVFLELFVSTVRIVIRIFDYIWKILLLWKHRIFSHKIRTRPLLLPLFSLSEITSNNNLNVILCCCWVVYILLELCVVKKRISVINLWLLVASWSLFDLKMWTWVGFRSF
jgi:hypothetical protein